MSKQTIHPLSSHPARRLFPALVVAAALASLALLLWYTTALANQVVGQGTPESCTGTALQAAVSAGGLVTFNCGQSAENPVTIAITQTISISATVTLDGGEAEQITLHGGDSGSGPRNGVGLLQVAEGVTAEVRQLTLTRAGDSAIRNYGSLTLDGVEIYYARALACAGVESSGTLLVRGNSIISSNNAETDGGGVCVLAGTARIENTSIQFNTAQNGGGLYLGGSSTTSDQDSYYSTNIASNAGGAVFVGPGATYQMNFSALANNSASAASSALGGGLYNLGSANLISAVIVENDAYDGGGLYNVGVLNVRGSDVENNHAEAANGRGGGLFNTGQADYTGSSLVNNQAANGGGFYNSGLLNLVNVTLSSNTATVGGNLSTGGETHLRYSTLAQNTPEDLRLLNTSADALGSIFTACVFDSSSLLSLGYNLDSGDTCTLTGPGDLTQTDPLLGPLETSEGRYTWHHRPADNSPAVDGGEATCPDAQHEDQHGALRPAGAACDLGAVEVGGVIPTATATSEPTATATTGPSATPTASPTPGEYLLITETPTPTGPYTFPAPTTTEQAGFTIQLSNAEGRPGELITVNGGGASLGVRLTWASEQVTFNGADVPVQPNGSYQATLQVPEYYGDLQVCAATGDPRRARFTCADFFVNAPEESALIVNFTDPLPINASVHILDHAGNTIYSAAGENDRSITLSGLTPGAYHLSVQGAMYNIGQVQLNPGTINTANIPKMVDLVGTDPVTNQVCYRNAAVGRVQAQYSYTGFYTSATNPDPVTRQGALEVEKAWVNNNFTYLAPQAEFGTFLSGVALPNEFRAVLNGSVGEVQAVEYWVLGEGQATWVKIGQSGAAPYAVSYNVGLLPPGTAQLLAAPVINGQRQCGHIARINLVANPVGPDFVRNKIILWDAASQTYRFTGMMPNIPFLPFAYQSDPWVVEPLGDIATVLSAGVRTSGTIELNQVMHLNAATAETTVQVLGIRPTRLNNEINMLPGGSILVNPNDPRSMALSTGRMHLGELLSVSVNTPKIVAFSFFGIANAYVRFTFGMQGDMYMQATIYPMAPALDVVLEPQASASFGVIIGADVLGGLIDGSAEVGAAAILGLPLRIQASENPSVGLLNPRFCLYGYIQFHYDVLWGVFSDSSDPMPLVQIPSRCTSSQQVQQANATLQQRVSAAPALAGDATGRMVSVYLEDSTPTAESAAPRVMARTWNTVSQNWETAVALTAPGLYVSNPTVAMLGESGQALAAWVQSTQTEEESLAGDYAAALAHMEIYTAFYDGAAWGAPVRLTEDNLPDGSPVLAADALGATLAWVRHSDGDIATPGGTYIAVQHWDGTDWSPRELLTGSDTSTGANPVSDGSRLPATNGQPSLARTLVAGQSEIVLAWTYELNNTKRVVVAHNRTQPGLWYMLDTASLPAHSSAASITLPAGQSEQVELAFTVASLGTDGSIPNLGNLSTIWTARLTDLGDSTAVSATPLQDADGTPVRGEKPELQLAALGERVLTFRHFGDPGSDSEFGQIAVSRAVGASVFAAPLNLTSGAQHWQGSALVNRATNNLTLLSVQVSQFQAPANQRIAPHVALQTEALNATGNALLSLAYPAEADPAIEGGLSVSQVHLPVGATAVVTATVHNLGREDALVRVNWWQGEVGSGTLLATSGLRTIHFNEIYPFNLEIPVSGGSQPISAEIVATGGNLLATNDQATLDIGLLPAPTIASISPTALFPNALQIAYAPSPAPDVAGYRILRRAADESDYQLVGETIGLVYYDAMLDAGETYCYVVQAYDAAGMLSANSTEQCRVIEQTINTVYLPLISR